MERKYGRVPGDQPSWVTSGFVVEATPNERRAMWDNSVAVLAALHRADASRFHFLLPRNDLSGLTDHLAYCGGGSTTLPPGPCMTPSSRVMHG